MNDKTLDKDLLYKMLFALELAFLPFFLATKFIMPQIMMTIVLGIIVAIRLVMVLLKDNTKKTHIYLDVIGSFIVVLFLTIAFCAFGKLNLILAILIIAFYAIEELLKLFFFNRPNNTAVEWLHFSVELLSYVLLASMMMANYTTIVLFGASLLFVVISALVDVIQGYNYFYFYVFKKEKSVEAKKLGNKKAGKKVGNTTKNKK